MEKKGEEKKDTLRSLSGWGLRRTDHRGHDVARLVVSGITDFRVTVVKWTHNKKEKRKRKKTEEKKEKKERERKRRRKKTEEKKTEEKKGKEREREKGSRRKEKSGKTATPSSKLLTAQYPVPLSMTHAGRRDISGVRVVQGSASRGRKREKYFGLFSNDVAHSNAFPLETHGRLKSSINISHIIERVPRLTSNDL